MKLGRLLPLLALVLFSGFFAYFNAGQRVALGLGFTTLYRVPFVAVVFTAFLLGMLTMFLVGLNHDRRMRRLLREREDAARQRRMAEPPSHAWQRPTPPDESTFTRTDTAGSGPADR
jgi:uncharacterized integral membrane protein